MSSLVIAILILYWPVKDHEFINFDDYDYVVNNTYVNKGLSLQNLYWAFSATHSSNWHTLTWISHMMDAEFFGMNPGMHHVTNVIFHIFNTLLLFFLFEKMTNSVWRSGILAALFALHPLHIESVAWISERKDVLSTFFWLLTMWAYIKYVRNPKPGTYLPVILFFICGLMSKPMTVTLPFVLLLLDYWPLCRISFSEKGNGSAYSNLRFLILEKIPLLSFSVLSGIITLIAQKKGGAIGNLEVFSAGVRISNAAVSYVTYLIKTILPFHLSVFYPHPRTVSFWQTAGALLVLALISFFVFRHFKTRPWLTVGWLWYLGTLVPVIGLIQVGNQSMADRYTYVPLIGIFIMGVWGISEAVPSGQGKKCLTVSAILVLCFFWEISQKQVRYWKNDFSLFGHALAVTENNFIAHNNLGNLYIKEGDRKNAIMHFQQSIAIQPGNVMAHHNLGNVYMEQNQLSDAVHHFSQVILLDPNYADAYYMLGMAKMRMGNMDEAVHHFYDALRLSPEDADVHNDLAIVMVKQGRIKEAVRHFQKAAELKPEDPEIKNNLQRASEMLQSGDNP